MRTVYVHAHVCFTFVCVLPAAKKLSGRHSKSVRAGLKFPPGRIGSFIRKMCSKSALRMSDTASVYAAAVLEYVMAEAIRGGVDKQNKKHRHRLLPRNIYLGIHNDDDMSKMFHNITIPGGGFARTLGSILADKA